MSVDRSRSDHIVAAAMLASRADSIGKYDIGAEGAPSPICFGSFQLAIAERRLFRDGVPVQIGGRAFDLLAVLILRAGEVIGSRELLRLVWPHAVVEEANLRVCVATLRKALGENRRQPQFIVNVPGRGYTFAGATNRSGPERSGPFDTRSAAGTQRQSRHLQVLVSCNSVHEILSRLLSSPCFARVAGVGMGKGVLYVATRPAAASSREHMDDVSCFVCLDPPVTGPRHSGTGSSAAFDVSLHRHPDRPRDNSRTDRGIVVVLDRCRRPGEVALSLAEGPLRGAASVHFLMSNRDALGFEREYLPALASFAETRETADLVEVLKTIGVTAMAYPQWEKKYGALAGEGIQRLHELEKENERLRKAVSDLTLEKLILKENSLSTF